MGAVFRNPALMATLGLAIIAWFIAFIGQCVGEARYNRREYRSLTEMAADHQAGSSSQPLYNTLWFAIWVQVYVPTCFVACLADITSLVIAFFLYAHPSKLC